MAAPKELSVAEIQKYMLENGCKVTNHALVKHFKRFLTNPATQTEARKQFKTYVNILATIKNENNQKYLILRKKYLNECPSEEATQRALAAADSVPSSPGGGSLVSETGLSDSPFRQPPPYKPPPEVTSPKAGNALPPPTTGATVEKENVENYRDCVNEFETVVLRMDPKRLAKKPLEDGTDGQEEKNKVSDSANDIVKPAHPTSISRENSLDSAAENKEKIPRFSFSSGSSGASADNCSSGDKVSGSDGDVADNPISVKEATRKFNRMASEEEAKVISPPSKKKQEENLIEEKIPPEVLLAHPKAKEWIVSMAKGNYQELAKLANEFPELVKLQDPSTTALHWAAKHGNEDVVKLIAGTYKAYVNARTNGGYTPLHLAMQFGRENIFELLCNVYKANRDLMDWSGNKPLDYLKQHTSVSLSTYSKIKARRKHTVEKDLGFLRIGSLNVRVKKTTEAFSNFLGVGNGNGNMNVPTAALSTANHHHQRHHRHHHHAGMMRNHHHTHPRTMSTQSGMKSRHHQLALPGSRASVPISNSSKVNANKYNQKIHKSWGSADNIPHKGIGGGAVVVADDDDDPDADKTNMPPPKGIDSIKKRNKSSKRTSTSSNTTDQDSISSSNSSSNLNTGYSSMPTTPNQLRAPIKISLSAGGPLGDSDSDSACGFGSNWSVSCSSLSGSNINDPRYV